jgi:hypothetical protein
MINNQLNNYTMKKDCYVSPEVRQRDLDIPGSLLASTTDYSSSSSLEGFEDDGENVIVW